MPRKPRKTPPGVSFANGLLEAVAKASGAGWFRDEQQSRLRSIIKNEFADLADAGLIHDNGYLDLVEHDSELESFPNGGRPGKVEPEDNTPLDISVEEVTISGPDEDDEGCGCEGPTLGGPMIISCET
jgi:hypothetical protein